MNHIETQQAKTPPHHYFFNKKNKEKLRKQTYHGKLFSLFYLLLSFLHRADRTNEGLISEHS